MKVLYIVPGTLSQTELGTEELNRRLGILRKIAPPDMKVDIGEVDEGPDSIESFYDEYLSIPGVIKGIAKAENDGYDGVVLGCFGDPGIIAAREMVDIPVVGPGEVSIHAAAMLGDKFSIIGVGSEFNYGYIKQVRDAGLESRLVSIKSSNLTVMDVNTNYEESKRIILKLCREAVEKDGADSLLLGCMSMAFMDISEELSSELDIPVVNAAKVSLYNLYSLIKSKLFFSPKTYGAVKGFPRRR
ncbi:MULTISPECIES: aspartate/glutamate racemase family protein [Tissierellales]|uniref:Hydantoin racemase n=1 Tax=Acidilutibacter cellobiosedens TaxID=2507161 RepID=A0A410QGZ8_9FIRM|nr:MULTISPECIES: aspartate/glutamate racemase family protein [Tissierellales]MBE6081226.1 hypothetical protein [Tissierellaceae bacterium]QAT63270.1 hypothetical protein EQM13_17730 [Acidilutibacter cellobiosedens]SCL95837.1 Hydantoin racemase [Sporanaerobacter sp. PP17-6a]